VSGIPRDHVRVRVEIAVAGGMENMDLAPYLIARGPAGATAWGDGQLYDSMLRDGLNDAFSDQAVGLAHTEGSGPRNSRSAATAQEPVGTAGSQQRLLRRRRLRASSRTKSLPSRSLATKGPNRLHNRRAQTGPETTLAAFDRR